MSHTKKPWLLSVNDAADAGPADGFSLIGGCGCCESPWMNGETQKERDANARLMVAAPDLLYALQGVLRVADRATDEFDAARAAIAKALGETP